MSKLAYLKRYNNRQNSSKRSLDNTKGKHQNTNTIHVLSKAKGLKILDDDADLNLICGAPYLSDDENDCNDENPLIPEFIDERPSEVIELEKFRQNDKWKLLNAENKTHANYHNRHDSDSDGELQHQKKKIDKETGSYLQQDKKMSDSGSDLSPERKIDVLPLANKCDYDCDLSPLRQTKRKEIEVIYRDKSGRKRNISEENTHEEFEKAKKKITVAKYFDWNKGLKQKEMQNIHVENLMHEISKPLARYQNDKDLDKQLRENYRDGDPMLEFIKKKKPTNKQGRELPKYKGPEPPPNRFNIQPGYRWDGVDRSNGFEKQYFSSISAKKALMDISYKWSVEDM